MQFKVPQKIDLEDKVIGPFTIKQFIYMLAGGMLDYIWFRFFSFGVFILLAIPTTIFFLAMALAHVQDQPFPKFLGSLILFVLRPKTRTWQKEAPVPKLMIRKPGAEQKLKPEPKKISRGELEKLSYLLDTKGWGKEESAKGERVVSHPEARPTLNIKSEDRRIKG